MVALLGAWTSHNLEYLRVWGAHGFAAMALHSAHLYMVPAGLAVLVAAVVGIGSTARRRRRLESDLTYLRRLVPPSGSRGVGGGSSFAIPSLLTVVWLLQVAVYLVQENVEAISAHAPAPGLGPLLGVHALAPLIHLAVALALVTMVCLIRRRVTELAAAVRAVAASLSAGRLVEVAAPPVVPRAWTPSQRWGPQRWCRPPPLAVQPF